MPKQKIKRRSPLDLLDELQEVKMRSHAVAGQRDKYRRFIVETGRWNEYLQWMAREIGVDEETVAELSSAPIPDGERA